MHVVAHYIDGRVLKGESMDLDPGRPICHVTPPGGARVRVELGELKALFVVRSLEGERFFLLPADPGSNNLRILVNRAAVAAIREGTPAAAARA